MVLTHRKRAVGIFRHREDAERALREMRGAGFPMDRVSVVNQHGQSHGDMSGAEVHKSGNKADEGATVGAISGGVLGGLTGLLVGVGALAIPGIGPVMLAGALATTLATALSGTAIGAVTGGLLGALIGLGIPEEQAKVYNERLSRGQYLVIIDGSEEEIARTQPILYRHDIEEFHIYDAPAGTASTTVEEGHAVAPLETPVAKTRKVTPLENPVATSPVVTSPVATSPVATPSESHVLTTTGNPAVSHPESRPHYAVGIFPHRRDAENAIRDLREVGFPLNRISLIAKHLEPRDPLTGVDLRHHFEPTRMGFPDDRARFYYDRVEQGDDLVIIQGTPDEIARAEAILKRRGIQEYRLYDPSLIGTDRTGQAYVNNPDLVTDATSSNSPDVVVAHTHPDVVIIDRRDEVF